MPERLDIVIKPSSADPFVTNVFVNQRMVTAPHNRVAETVVAELRKAGYR